MLGQIREAVRLGKRIVLIHEQDSRFHAVDFGSEKNASPDDLKHLFDDHESIPWRRRKFERQAVLSELMRRAGASFEQYFEQCIENEKRDPTLAPKKRRAERRVSVMSPESLWLQDGYFWYRVAVSANSAVAAMFAASTVACLAKSGKIFC